MKWLILVCSVLLGLSVCQPPPTSTPVPESGPHFLLTTSGRVQIKRAGWRKYIPVAFGTTLQSDDLLQIEDEATVLCANLEVKSVSGVTSTPCSPEPGTLAYHGARYVGQRSAPKDIPYVLYPRNTLVLDSRPWLRWHDTGASSYTVAIVQGGNALWTQTDVTSSQLPYPADQLPIQPDVDYLLLVTDNDSGLASSADPARGIGFRLATQAELDEIEAGQDRILAVSGLSGPPRDFVLGVYYARVEVSESGFSPMGEAWLAFEALAQTQDVPATHLWRGDVLTRLKLPAESEAAFQAALQSAETLGDLESQAAAQRGLWYVTGDEVHFDEAVALYGQLGDKDQVEALGQEKSQ